MKALHIFILTSFILFGIVSCTTTKSTTTTTNSNANNNPSTTATEPKKGAITQEDADNISKKMSLTTVADLNNGGTIYSAECGVCHGLKKPNARSEDEWKAIVPNMVQKANTKAGKIQITPGQEQLILKYLVVMCNK
ncbi:MAG: hypothetical protein WCP57_01300 [Bacteroidota bacterium]